MSNSSFVRKPSIDEVLTPKPDARPRIYAYSIADAAHHGQLKVGQTTRDVKRRVAEQLKTAAIQNFTIELDGPAERDDGSIFTDHEVRDALVKKGFEKVKLEWVRCTVADVATVLAELRTGQRLGGSHHETFGLRDEQLDAVNKTLDYYQSIWVEDANAAPRFLWNAKMRFGKTSTTYQLAKKLQTQRVLVLTFQPAVEDAWQTDLAHKFWAKSCGKARKWQGTLLAAHRPEEQLPGRPARHFGSAVSDPFTYPKAEAKNWSRRPRI